MFLTMTHGQMPTREQYDVAWDRTAEGEGLRDGLFHFGNDPRMGTCALKRDELWGELETAAHLQDHGADDAGDWCSRVLLCLGIEWV
jgi:hypothetical protein